MDSSLVKKKKYEVLAIFKIIANIMCFTYVVYDCQYFSLKCKVSVSLKLNQGDKASPLIFLKQDGGYMAGFNKLYMMNHIRTEACILSLGKGVKIVQFNQKSKDLMENSFELIIQV